MGTIKEDKSHEQSESLLSRIRNVNPIIAILLILGVGLVVFSCFFSALFVDTDDGRLKIRIIYPGSWDGTISDDYGAGPVSGTGDKTYNMKGRDTTAVISKMDDSENELTVQILLDGEVVVSESTTEPHGTVSISYSY